jgi:hypothetical protein
MMHALSLILLLALGALPGCAREWRTSEPVQATAYSAPTTDPVAGPLGLLPSDFSITEWRQPTCCCLWSNLHPASGGRPEPTFAGIGELLPNDRKADIG